MRFAGTFLSFSSSSAFWLIPDRLQQDGRQGPKMGLSHNQSLTDIFLNNTTLTYRRNHHFYEILQWAERQPKMYPISF